MGIDTEFEVRSAGLVIVALCLVLAAIGSSCSKEDTAAPTFVGRMTCVECHEQEHAAWQGSHHDLAMQEVSEQTVLGDFGDATFTHFGEESRFYRDSDAFMVRTAGPDGKPADFEIAYVFGVYPLQQYLIRFPGGRLQTLSLCWDARPQSDGGQRWFHIYPDERIAHDDELHWTGPNQNWNFMCAQCHSTNLRKNFDLATDSYATTWSEIDVSCEACHGPASQHLAWAKLGAEDGVPMKGLLFDLASKSQWRFEEGAVTATRVSGPEQGQQIEKCAACHARRTSVSEDYGGDRTLLDGHRLALLEEGLYHADGQIEDEVYVYGSFRQSKMYHAGVTCSDCHESHSLNLISEGNLLCARCHQFEVFDTPEHHHHEVGSKGAQCVECHMPSKHYMVVDPRRDHSMRVPRPDLSGELATPNACTQCHLGKSNRWAAEAIAEWVPDKPRPPHFGTALHAGRIEAAGAESQLQQLAGDDSQPGIARATALSLLESYATRSTLETIRSAAKDPDALVRFGALQALEPVPLEFRRKIVLPLLSDPVRTVRIEAVRVLSDVLRDSLEPMQQMAFDAALAEFVSFQELNADRPWAHLNLGLMHMRMGKLDAARQAYEDAIAVDRRWTPAYVNLADLHRMNGSEQECERVIRAGLAVLPQDAELHHVLGLSLVRSKQIELALESLQRAVQFQPNGARFSYGYAVALHSTGKEARAIEVLERAQETEPRNLEILYALATFNRDRGRADEARRWARELQAIAPAVPEVMELVRELSRLR